MKFKTSRASQEFIEEVHLRVGARNKAVLGRAALFLALGQGLPPNYRSADSQGVDLDDETVIGEDLRDVVRAALNFRSGKSLDEAGYRQSFRLHFEYGCQILKQLWEDSGNDQVHFVSELLKDIGSGPGVVGPITGKRPIPIVENEVKLKILSEQEDWSINGPGTKNGLLVISGEPGSGKSQLALDLLVQLAEAGVRFVFFDLKGELEDDPGNPQQRKNRTKFLQQTGAQYTRLINDGLPINPLIRDPNPTANAQIAHEIASLIRTFAPQLGAKQERVISNIYQQLLRPDFPSLAEELEESGATGVEIAVIEKIVDLKLFADAQKGITPEDWLSNSIVIDFKELGNDNDTKSLAVALILNFLMKRLNQNLAVKKGIQPIKMVLFVDEAHLLLPKEGKSGLLGRLARQGRSWGFPLWLASQDADAFITKGANATDFAELAKCGIHFSPHTLSQTEQRKVLGGMVHQKITKGEAILRLHGKLHIGIARQFWKDGGK